MKPHLLVIGLFALLPAVSTASPSLPEGAIPVPITTQSTNYSCGAATLASVLKYFGLFNGHESELWPLLGTNSGDGTPPLAIMRAGQKFGLNVRLSLQTSIEQLRNLVRRGKPAIVGFQAWRNEEDKEKPWQDIWNSGHYAIVTAVDDRYVYFMDPSLENVTKRGTYGAIPIEDFLNRWHDEDTFDNNPTNLVRHNGLAIFFEGRRCQQALEIIE